MVNMARMPRISNEKLANGAGDRDFFETKLMLGRFFMTKTLPDTSALLSKIMAGAAPLMAMEADAF